MFILYIIVTVIITLLIAELIGYGIHKLSHKRWTGPLYRHHMLHHTIYVPKNYDSDEYISNPAQSFVVWMTPPFILIATISYLLLPLYLSIAVIIILSIDAYLTDYIHEKLHLRKNWIHKYKYIEERQILHWIHHRNVRKNMGVNIYVFDRLFGSYERNKNRYNNRITESKMDSTIT